MRLWKLLPSLLLLLTITACSPAATPTQSVTSPTPAKFEVGPVAIEPAVVMLGDPVSASTTIQNTGETAGTYTATLLVNGQKSTTQAVSLNPGGSQTVTFQLYETTASNYNLSIGTSSTILTVYNWVPAAIQYDHSDGVSQGIYVSDDNGHIVRFTPPNKAYTVQKIRILGGVKPLNTYELDSKSITIRIWDKDANNLLWSRDFPWRSFIGLPIWRVIDVPNVRVNDDFNVELVTHSVPASYRSDGSVSYGGDQIGFVQLAAGGAMPGAIIGGTQSIVVIGFDYPESYVNSPANRPQTRSGYSYMGKLIDPGQGRFEGIQWLIRVEGEGAPGGQ